MPGSDRSADGTKRTMLPGTRQVKCRPRSLVSSDGVRYVFDFFSGTSTSAALYALRAHANARVVCVDRDHDLNWVVGDGYIERKYLSRYLHIHKDVFGQPCWRSGQLRLGRR